MILRKLNEAGMEAFSDWLERGAPGAMPAGLLTDEMTSDKLSSDVRVDPQRKFENRYEFGKYLCGRFDPLDDGTLELDRFFWSTTALIWFDELCVKNDDGSRRLGREYRYILSSDFRHHYRHTVRSCWQLVRDHGENARFMLLAQRPDDDWLGRHGDILEQIGGRQSVLRNNLIVKEAAKMYSDPSSGRPLRGVAGREGGSVRRLAMILRQLDLNYDIHSESMGAYELRSILPREFDRWKD